MDDHIRVCEELFSAARSEFKHLEYFYFHNCVYESVWKDNRRRHANAFATSSCSTYPHRLQGDLRRRRLDESPTRSFSPAAASTEPGATWLRRLAETWPHAIWLNPESEQSWPYRQSTSLIYNLMGGRMFPLTLDGLERGMRLLSK
jgi:uncharacterized protein with von Willebrand factor type A (vWA) domain